MKKLPLLCLALLFAIRLDAGNAYVESLNSSPWMTPEMCSESPPEIFFEMRVNERPKKLDVNGSMAGEDAFFQAYADNLAIFTNQHCPLAARIRAPLYDAFASVFEFIRSANGNGVTHYNIRLPARVEWQIYSGFKNNFVMAFTGRYSIGDLRTIARIFWRAYGHERFVSDNSDPLATHFETGMRKLQEAEAILIKDQPEEGLLGNDGVYHFRTQMMGMFGQFLGR